MTGFSQTWLNLFVDDHQIGYINKIGKKRKKKTWRLVLPMYQLSDHWSLLAMAGPPAERWMSEECNERSP
jgi:hypothetical protein